jgi:phosphoglycerol transferase MdoB-like AlkP superfamily enzyme
VRLLYAYVYIGRGEMNLLGLFDKYFLMLVLIHGLFLSTIDYKRYKNQKAEHIARKARIIGSSISIISVVLFIIATIAN